jgi:hypothetical protein
MAVGGQITGPFSEAEIGAAIATGRMRPETPVWSAGMADWAPASTVQRFATLFAPRGTGSGTPPPPPAPES